jgi:hypothetical protein
MRVFLSDGHPVRPRYRKAAPHDMGRADMMPPARASHLVV